jgi:hypothetical protein
MPTHAEVKASAMFASPSMLGVGELPAIIKPFFSVGGVHLGNGKIFL